MFGPYYGGYDAPPPMYPHGPRKLTPEEYLAEHENEIWEMDMNDVLNLDSPEYPGTMLEEIEDEAIDISGYFYERLARKMRHDGINKVPVLVDDIMHGLWNGRHRVRIAYELGHHSMRVTTNDDLSGYARILHDREIL